MTARRTAGSSAGGESETKVPRPRTVTSTPSFSSDTKARCTASRLIFRSTATCRMVANRSPGLSRPVPMARRICPRSCTWIGTPFGRIVNIGSSYAESIPCPCRTGRYCGSRSEMRSRAFRGRELASAWSHSPVCAESVPAKRANVAGVHRSQHPPLGRDRRPALVASGIWHCAVDRNCTQVHVEQASASTDHLNQPGTLMLSRFLPTLYPILYVLRVSALCFTAATAVHAKDMTFSLQVKDFRPNFDLYEYIFADGDIVPGTKDRFLAFLANYKLTRAATVIFNSSGGSLMEGMELGDAIRARHFRTNVGTRAAQPPAIEPGKCINACIFSYLGGITDTSPMAVPLESINFASILDLIRQKQLSLVSNF